MCVAAFLCRVPVILHESDAIPGLANRWCARFCKKILVNFTEAAKHFPSAEDIVHIPALLSAELFTDTKTQKKSKTEILVLCGSQGSARIFEALLDCIGTISDVVFHVVLGTQNTNFAPAF